MQTYTKTVRKYSPLFILFVLTSVIGIVNYQFGFLTVWQNKIFDRFFIQQQPISSIVIVAVDDESLVERGGWPIPRADLAKVIDYMQSAKAIGVDIALVDPSPKGNADDAILAHSLEKSIPPIFLASQFDDRGGKKISPLPLFLHSAQTAFVNVISDQDGVIRDFHPIVSFNETEEKSMSLSLSYSFASPQSDIYFPHTVKIDYQGKAKTFLTIPFIDVYNGTVPENVWKNKIVLIGATAPDLHDILTTPFGSMPGVEIHANAIYTLSHNLIFHPISDGDMYIFIILSNVLAIFVILFIRRVSLLIFSLVLIFAGLNIISIVAFSRLVLFPNLTPSLSFILTVGACVIFQYISESKEKKVIRSMFQYYLMPEVVKDLVTNPEKLKLGGEKRMITIFFSDIRDFTALSESLSAEQITMMTNQYLTSMTDVIMKQRGLVDKYIGDAIMAFWGAPVENPDQAMYACRAVLEMSGALRDLNHTWIQKSLPLFKIGMGVNMGEAIVGNIGSEKRFNYTALGDEVNFSSRLESLNKIYGTECIVSESIFNKVKDTTGIVFRRLDHVKVKGKKESKWIFELITIPVNETIKDMLIEFEKGRRLYEQGNWQAALEHFKEIVTIKDDGPSKVFLERCQTYIKTPPENWDGVYIFNNK